MSCAPLVTGYVTSTLPFSCCIVRNSHAREGQPEPVQQSAFVRWKLTRADKPSVTAQPRDLIRSWKDSQTSGSMLRPSGDSLPATDRPSYGHGSVGSLEAELSEQSSHRSRCSTPTAA